LPRLPEGQLEEFLLQQTVGFPYVGSGIEHSI
jgi:hypothetical protein